MRRLFVALTSSVSVLAFTHMASAADLRMPLKAPPPLAPPVQDWSGVYVGVEGGYGWGHSSFSSATPFGLHPSNTKCFNADQFSGGSLKPDATPFTGDCTNTSEFDDFQQQADQLNDPNIPFSGRNQSGGVVGGFFGVQKQWGSWVLGAEASVDYAHISSSTGGGFTLTNSITSALPGAVCASPGDLGCENHFTSKSTSIGQFSSTINEIGAVNAKVGYAWSPNWMIYGTGGMAFAHEQSSFSFSNSLFHLDCDTTDGPSNCNGITGVVGPNFSDGEGFVRFANESFAGSGGTTMFGWTAGAGIDYKWQLDPGSAIIFGIDYKHYGFGNHTFTLAGSNGGSFSVNASESIDVVKGRISYLFSIH
jgi:opacity protein-like surface antigen